MSTRAIVAIAVAIAGLVLGTVAYFGLAAPWGFPPDTVDHSNPRVPFAPTLFVLGVIVTFLAAVIYELWPDHDY
ncbi:MAG: hypothetical protein Kow0010_21310 [Dehalococcoidia bacterium]